MSGMRERTEPNRPGRPSEELPCFSDEFIAEVGDCDDLDSFRDLLEGRGLWLNRQAAFDVFGYLRSVADASALQDRPVPDERLADVVGGVATSPLDSPTLLPLLAEMARRL